MKQSIFAFHASWAAGSWLVLSDCFITSLKLRFARLVTIFLQIIINFKVLQKEDANQGTGFFSDCRKWLLLEIRGNSSEKVTSGRRGDYLRSISYLLIAAVQGNVELYELQLVHLNCSPAILRDSVLHLHPFKDKSN